MMVFFISSCSKTNENNFIPGNVDLSLKQQSIIQNTNDFGIRIFKNMNSTAGNTNLFISPLSISMALGMTYNGSAGSTKTAFESTLGFTGFDQKDINITYKTLLDYFPTCDNKVTLDIANSIWYRQDFPVLQNFIDTNKKYFNAMISPLDFSDPGAKDIINKWVSDNTNNKIPSIINEISSDNVMFLINAVYFKGLFKMTFDKTKTTDAPFKLTDGTIKQVLMMNQKASHMFFENSVFSSIEMPYNNGRFNIEIFVPKDGSTVNDIIDQITVPVWNSWLSSYTKQQEVTVSMPKFKFSYEETLNNSLTALGLGVAFNSTADFTNINRAGNLLISEVKHKTYVDVNEEGTEAAAVTSIGISVTSIGNPIIFSVDRPFLFMISEKESKSILFMGKVVDPVY
jgi:serine protease inhibitor